MNVLCLGYIYIPSHYIVPLSPTGFNITGLYHGTMETTITLEWDPPDGSGPEAIVDNYTISISPDPPYKPAINFVLLPPWNVTLTHNVEYTINVTALNCFGESSPTVLSNTYSKLKYNRNSSMILLHSLLSKLWDSSKSNKWDSK